MFVDLYLFVLFGIFAFCVFKGEGRHLRAIEQRICLTVCLLGCVMTFGCFLYARLSRDTGALYTLMLLLTVVAAATTNRLFNLPSFSFRRFRPFC